jgi:hypothetical protein
LKAIFQTAEQVEQSEPWNSSLMIEMFNVELVKARDCRQQAFIDN